MLRTQNENLLLSVQNMSKNNAGSVDDKKHIIALKEFIETLKVIIYGEIKRRLQILRISSVDKLLFKIGIKSQKKDKFDESEASPKNRQKKSSFDYATKLKSLLEISDLHFQVIKHDFKKDFDDDIVYAKEMVKFIYSNLESPFIIPTDAYIQQTLLQLQAFNEKIIITRQTSFNNFPDLLTKAICLQNTDDIYFEVLQKLMEEYFEIDMLSASVIVNHLLKKSSHFT